MNNKLCEGCPIYNDGLFQLKIRKNIKGAPKYRINHNQKRILLEFEGFGRNEDLANIPVIGRSGKLIDQLLEESQLNKFSLMFHNAVKCRPIRMENDKDQNRTPTDEEIEYCFSRYHHEELAFDPHLIIAFGRIPTKAFFPDKEPAQIRGKGQYYKYNDKDYLVLSTYHPAYILRNPSARPTLLKHLTNAYKYLTEEIK